MHGNTLNTIKEIAQPIVEQEDMFLVDVEVKGAKVPEVWVLVDTEEGDVNLDTCSQISRELSFLLEDKSVFEKAYRLNVSSPGLSRPLSDWRQYPKNQGRTARVKYKKDNEYFTVEGVLLNVTDEQIEVKPEDDKLVLIPIEEIVETKIIPKI